MKTVVIGGNAAGMTFATKFKRNNPNEKIIVLESRKYVSLGGCGLPYYLAGYVNDSKNLLARSVQQIIDLGIDLRINSHVNQVDKVNKIIHYFENGEKKQETYQQLIICSGAQPRVMKFGEYNKQRIHTLASIDDGEKLKKQLQNPLYQHVTIIGSGFIGLEVLDSLIHLKKQVTLIDISKNIMGDKFSEEILKPVQQAIIDAQVDVKLSTTIDNISDIDDYHYQITANQKTFKTNIIVLALGFVPNSDFIDVDKIANGAILTDQNSHTSEKNIYAIGDCATIYNQVTKKMDYIALATSANKQGRMMADYLSNKKTFFKGMLPSSCLKVLDYELGFSGVSEKSAKLHQLNYKTAIIDDKNQTGYYPGQEDVKIKLIYHAQNNVILGVEMVCKKGVIGRVNAIAVAIQAGITTNELGYIDFCYSPPFARTWDVLNNIGNVAK